MILSKSAVYALRAIICLAEEGGDHPVRVDDIAERLGVPRNYLSKILHILAREGLLGSTRGPGGGFRLATPPEEVHLVDVVRHFDDVPDVARCLLGRGLCLDSDPCAAHARWKGLGSALRRFLEETTVADLSSDHEANSPRVMT